GVWRRRGNDQIDLVAQDKLGGHLGRAAAARLAVFADDLHLIGAAADLQALAENAAHLLEDEAVGLAEAGGWAGFRADVPDLDDAALGIGRNDAQHRRRSNGADQRAPRDTEGECP